VTGIDLSPVAIEKAEEEAESRGVAAATEFRVMNAEALDFPDDSFGLVCGTGILHHLDLDRAYGEIARVLRPDGRAVFVEPLGHNPAINLYRRRTPELRTEDEHPLVMPDLERASEYFQDVDPRFFHLSTLLAVPARSWKRFDPLLNTLGRFDDALFRALPALRRYAWLVALVFARPRPRPEQGELR
jgi:SAM-dependent methyltransferase